MPKISDRTEQYINDYMKCCSNELESVDDYVGKQPTYYREWLTVDDAKSACLIEREEVLREVTTWIRANLSQFDITDANGYTVGINNVVCFFIQHFKTI